MFSPCESLRCFQAFASVVMLYVNMEVNGTPLKAFIDSGAQMTIMYVFVNFHVPPPCKFCVGV